MSDAIILKQCRDGSAIAFIPDAEANPGMIQSYQHIGQHGEASLPFYWECRPLSPRSKEGRELLKELRAIGYKVKLRRRLASWRQRGSR
jgi:hypothetical protein